MSAPGNRLRESGPTPAVTSRSCWRRPPRCSSRARAAADAGEIRPGTDAFGLLYAVGNLCAGVSNDPRYDARRMVGLLIAGLFQPDPASR